MLQQLISIPSFSKEEDKTAEALQIFLAGKQVPAKRYLNNIWATNKFFDPTRPSILLNSHHDTVRPNPQYTNEPFAPIVEDGKLYGLGSNDAGGCVVSLVAAFVHFYDKPLRNYNLVIALSAEEEISGRSGIEALLTHPDFVNDTCGAFRYSAGNNSCAIVGEPTLMDLAVAEKGLMVLDCTATGKAGHAAREEGENAIFKALKDIEWFRTFRFNKVSEWLGAVKMSVTVIETENKAHNMVPSVCKFVVDIRITEIYTHEEVLDTIRKHVGAEAKARSMRMRSTGINISHPLVKSGISMGRKCYGSPTSSDKALMPFPALKCGPGDSARSHTADEFIYLKEIEEGIEGYIRMLEGVL